ncbi:hypothetical protein DPMN_036481 [Dreissena polymorpha]|uniref:Uncharacterized protein n=1 Tax=Dreissena polymorpha TaxID=45954 RepID=A0A9D4MDN3_DREPO|nr:hypothetical protein DPMN_036481 [Dreissena polymorpha]
MGWTRQQAGISVNVCALGHARERSTSRPSDEKLDRLCEKVDVTPNGCVTSRSPQKT